MHQVSRASTFNLKIYRRNDHSRWDSSTLRGQKMRTNLCVYRPSLVMHFSESVTLTFYLPHAVHRQLHYARIHEHSTSSTKRWYSIVRGPMLYRSLGFFRVSWCCKRHVRNSYWGIASLYGLFLAQLYIYFTTYRDKILVRLLVLLLGYVVLPSSCLYCSRLTSNLILQYTGNVASFRLHAPPIHLPHTWFRESREDPASCLVSLPTTRIYRQRAVLISTPRSGTVCWNSLSFSKYDVDILVLPISSLCPSR